MPPAARRQPPTRGLIGEDYDLRYNTIDGGGTTFSNAVDYDLGGTAGQPDAGVLSGGDYVLTGGFWIAAEATLPTGCGGDCNLDGNVSTDELVRAVDVALGTRRSPNPAGRPYAERRGGGVRPTRADSGATARNARRW